MIFDLWVYSLIQAVPTDCRQILTDALKNVSCAFPLTVVGPPDEQFNTECGKRHQAIARRCDSLLITGSLRSLVVIEIRLRSLFLLGIMCLQCECGGGGYGMVLCYTAVL